MEEKEVAALAEKGGRLERKTISGAKLLTVIRTARQSVTLSECVIDGDLNLETPEGVYEVIKAQIQLLNCRVTGRTSLVGCVFESSLNVSGTTFDGPVVATQTYIDGQKVVVRGVIFRSSFRAERTRFRTEVVFARGSNGRAETEQMPAVVFEADASFRQALFEGEADFAGARFREVDFSQAIFNQSAGFRAVRFQFGCAFARTRFKQDAHFTAAEFTSVRLSPTGWTDAEVPRCEFRWAVFEKLAVFDLSALVGPALFQSVEFQGDSSFMRLRGWEMEGDGPRSDLVFEGCAFRGPFRCGGKVRKLSFGASPSCVFERPTAFRGVEAEFVRFHGTQFNDTVAIEEVKNGDWNFYNCRFRGDLELRRVPREVKVTFDTTYLDKSLLAEWDAITSRGHPLDVHSEHAAEGWAELERAFGRAGNVEGSNEALYRKRVAEGNEHKGSVVLNDISWAVWGYGVRPLRVVGCAVLVIVLFACLYRTQTASIQCADEWETRRARWWFAFVFSLRTGWSLDFGRSQSVTLPFQIATAFESILVKVLLVLFALSLAKVSPLLNEVVKKLLPL